MNKDTRGTKDFCENGLKENLRTCLLVLLYCESGMFLGKVRAKLDRGAMMQTIFIWCGSYSQVFKYSVSSLSSFHDPGTNFVRTLLSYSGSFVQHVATRWRFYGWQKR